MTALLRPGLCWTTALLLTVVAAAGCSKFVPLDEVADGALNALDDVPPPADVTVDGDGGVDTSVDVGVDVVDTKDADSQETSPADSVEDGDAGLPDTTDAEVTCPDACEPGATRCALDGSPQLERCQEPVGTPCTVWVVDEDCADDPCSGDGVCVDDACGHDLATAVTCDDHADPCWVWLCDGTSGACVESPAPAATACAVEDPCIGGSTCDGAGACIPGFEAECPCAAPSECPSWPDANLCDGAYGCVAGACVYDPSPVACLEHPSPCLATSCVEATGACVDVPTNAGAACDDEDLCTVSSECDDGACAGTQEKVCDLGPCSVALCDGETGECVEDEAITPCCGNGAPEATEACDGSAGCSESCTLGGCEGRSIDFAGDGCVSTQAGGLLPSQASWTVEFRVRVEDISHEGTLLAVLGAGAESSGLKVSADVVEAGPSTLDIELTDTAGDVTLLDGLPLVAKAWNHIAVTFAHDLAGSTLSVWMNGSLEASQPVSGAIGVTATHNLYVGCEGGANGTHGRFDEVRISTVVRYDASFDVASAPFAPDSETLLLYAFDDLEPGLAVDQGTGGHHGAWKAATLHQQDPFSVGNPISCGEPPCLRHSVSFDGAQGPSSAATSNYGSPGQDLAVAVAVRVDGPTGEQAIVSQGSLDGLSNGWKLTALPLGGSVRFRWYERQVIGGGLYWTFYNTVETVGVGEWVHVVVERRWNDGVSPEVVFHVNGDSEAPLTLNQPASLEVGGVPLVVGALSDGAQPLTGLIDSLHFIDGSDGLDPALTQPLSEVSATWQTVAIYSGDVGFGSASYSALPALYGPIEWAWGVGFSEAQPSWITPCGAP